MLSQPLSWSTKRGRNTKEEARERGLCRHGSTIIFKKDGPLLVAAQSAVNKLQISGADSTPVNKFSGAFNKFSGHSTNFGGIQQISGAFNSIQQQSTALIKRSGAFNKFRGHSTAFNKVSGAFNSIQHDIQCDIQNGRFARLSESQLWDHRPKTVLMRFCRNFEQGGMESCFHADCWNPLSS
jgi:hypothetical protein